MQSGEIPEINLYALLDRTTLKFPTQTAIIYKNQLISYQVLKEKVDRLACALLQVGCRKGERIGLMISNHPSYVTAYYAALKLGLIIVQVNPMYTPRELLEIFQDAGVEHLVVEPENYAKIAELPSFIFKNVFLSEASDTIGNCLSIDELIEAASKPLESTCPVSAKTDVAVIQYTGGTTGKKKGAMLTHYNLVANVMQSKALYGEKMLFGKETVLTATPLYHVYGMTAGMNLGIYIGASNILMKKFQVDEALANIAKHRPTFFPGVPKMYNAFVNHPEIEQYELNCFKFCSSGSAPLPVEVLKKFERLTGASIGEGYGLSETSPSTHRNPPDGLRKVGSIGIPLPGTECRIVNENGEDLPIKTVGELLIRGPQVMLGYWNKPEETREALRDGWLYTGDLATVDEDGYFYIVGRKKEMILIGGFNVYPQEIEGVLYEHPDIQEAAVVGVPDPEFGEMVKAFVVPKQGRNIDLNELKEFCYQQLTRYKVPKVYEIRDSLPRNTVGKLLKRMLVEK
ncbi:long-chain-fatty-acid--CoA ligase [Neobacillus sp. SM06]|uniref:long-chain-fatty-acid--CoA ligase n=1 Tax=Neobacillus sp. SM06 TaxID=3422492 RepID=UPI003D271F5C